eukprot:CAMPEP_0185263556 /NCGR_PEP_ID=MMETSP1359-20130426/15292_1 /TAXON_ID=552665 /ORGANISM="Bigelowiella longifila, Strain CCMP242" /LENGTH=179 /DNA_ID=CAMNT_0027851167 /DNA_START=120 /DNA_END=659 /DNA_ORIENTATION=+
MEVEPTSSNSRHGQRDWSNLPSPDVKNLPKIPNRDKILELMKDNKKRFLLELEFVELLASPLYLERLAKLKYFSDPRFIRYLEYLNYWRKPQYIKFISYPYCLYFLELLQKKEFRDKLIDPQYVALLHHQQYLHWRHHKHLRMRELEFERQKEENKGDSNPVTAADQNMPALEQVSSGS